MSTATVTLKGRKVPVYRAKTQKSRAKLARKLFRESEMTTVSDLADESGLCWQTVAKFLDVSPRGGQWVATKLPRHETVRAIFSALGYDLLIAAKKQMKGVVEV